MSASVTAAGYLVIAGTAALLHLAGRLRGRVPTLGQAVAAFNRLRFGRAALAAIWLWAGWHFFVRASWG